MGGGAVERRRFNEGDIRSGKGRGGNGDMSALLRAGSGVFWATSSSSSVRIFVKSMSFSNGDWGCSDWGSRVIEQICSGVVGGAGRVSGSPGGVRLEGGDAEESMKIVWHGFGGKVRFIGAVAVEPRRRFSVDAC